MTEQKPAPPTDAQFRQLVAAVRDVGIFLLTADGRVASWNLGAQLIKGYTADEIIGRHFSTFYPPDALARGWPEEELRRAAAEGRIEDEGWRLRKNGTRFWANVVITALRDADGKLTGFAKITRDLTDRRMHEEAMRTSEERLRLLIESAVDHAIFMLDPEGRVQTWNPGAQRINGYAATEIIGQHFSKFYPPESIARRWPEHELEVALERGRFEDEGWRVRKDGSQFWANVIISPMKDAQGRLRGYAKVTRDLTERDRVRALQRSEEHTDQFLAMLGHELRNPLGSISNAAQILRQAPSASASTKAAEILNRQVEHLSRMVDDLLDVSRIRTGSLSLRTERVELQTVLHRAIELAQASISAKRQELRQPQHTRALWLRGDSARLVQLFSNILGNASKYTPDGGLIVITLELSQSSVIVSISDTGKGIAPELLPRVFDLFTQGERSFDRRDGGLGVGLTLSRRIAELHGGSIEARSRGIGSGAEFLVRLPLLSEAVAENKAPEAQDAQPNAARILVCDDLKDSADSLAMSLRLHGYPVDVSYTGEQAVRLYKERRHDVLLLDIGLPDISGYEVCAAVRQASTDAAPLLIAITGYGQQHDRQRALEAGFNYHMVKPVDLQVLLATIRSHAVGMREHQP